MIFFTNLTLKQGQTLLLKNATATINPKQKVGLVGKNGCGKSSLLSLLKKQIVAESGDIKYPINWALSWVNQETPSLQTTALDYVIEGDREYCRLQLELKNANERNNGEDIARIHAKLDLIDAWTIQARAATLLHGLGFSQQQLQLPVKSFSGGWRMRLNLAQALLCPSDLLLLDEPTNHLDLDAVIWLERWLMQYQGTLILISHDRDFLDPIVNKILHIENQQLNEYTGDYSSFEIQRAEKLAQQTALYRQQQQKVAHLQKYIDRFKAKATKAKQAQSRIKALERMELIAPAYVDNPFTFKFRDPISLPNPLMSIDKAVAGYKNIESAVEILNAIKLNLVPGSRIGLLGRNGAGKSTLIKLLAGELSPISGSVEVAKGVKIGYFAQHQLDILRCDETALWHLQKIAPQQTEQQLRDYLGSFAFHGDKVNQLVKFFSGGEKARLVLSLIVWQRPNLLLLDEPTNHLDLDMRQALTEALVDYQGSLVVVSHDRYLLRSTVEQFYLVHNRKVEEFKGDLLDYQKWLAEIDKLEKIEKSESAVINPKENSTQSNRKEQKRREAELRQKSAPIRKKIVECEQKITEYNEKLEQITLQLSDASIYLLENKQKLTKILFDQNQYKKQLEQIEVEWFEQQELLEEMLD
ncbi:ABC transporter ATP-binding protein [Seminibacterium arietis]|uniref:ABC transporter ATP-binding protein n=1 Tax=Seminibacterium arietis TaxID=1173502 RepID=A0ABW3I9V0_9PAST